MYSSSLGKTLWNQKNFRYIWASQTAQAVGSILMTIIVMVDVFKETNSVFGSGLVLALSSFGSVLGGAMAAFAIQRLDLLQTAAYSTWFRAVCALCIGLCQSLGLPSYIIYMLLFLQSFVGSWYSPAQLGLLYQAIKKRDYVAASGSIVTVNQFVQAAGWGLGGYLTVLTQTHTLTVFTAGLFFVSGFLIKLPDLKNAVIPRQKTRTQSVWRTVYRKKTVLLLTMMDMSEGLANAVWTSAVLLAFTKEVLNKGEAWWGFINAGYFLGAILGGILAVLFSNQLKKRLGLMIVLGSVSMGITTLLFAYSSNPLLSVILCIMMGPLYQVRDVSQTVILQDTLTDEERAPVTAAKNTILTAWSVLTIAIMGALADLIGVQSVFIAAAVLYAGTAAVTFFVRDVRTYSQSARQHTKEEIEG
ncbi:MFS transporter [Bacillus paralicheniformis]|uniref:MFS transporter n=1 Tax=Bacillus paralicheniformis TaxID=1648923 RepID=UPI003D223EF7